MSGISHFPYHQGGLGGAVSIPVSSVLLPLSPRQKWINFSVHVFMRKHTTHQQLILNNVVLLIQYIIICCFYVLLPRFYICSIDQNVFVVFFCSDGADEVLSDEVALQHLDPVANPLGALRRGLLRFQQVQMEIILFCKGMHLAQTSSVMRILLCLQADRCNQSIEFIMLEYL